VVVDAVEIHESICCEYQHDYALQYYLEDVCLVIKYNQVEIDITEDEYQPLPQHAGVYKVERVVGWKK